MNDTAFAPDERAAGHTIEIEVMHDLVCPWCYLGARRLLRALRRRPRLRAVLRWRPFLLNPDMPRAGLPHAEYAARKFGGAERAGRLYASIARMAGAEGVDFRFDLIRAVPCSIDAHRLVRRAAAAGRADRMVEALYAAHFSQGRDIGAPATLAALAAAHDLPPQAIPARDAETPEAIRAETLRAHRMGINGVPCVVIAGRHAIAGAQEPEVIERLLDAAAAPMREPHACPVPGRLTRDGTNAIDG